MDLIRNHAVAEIITNGKNIEPSEWCMPVIPVFGKLSHVVLEFKASLDYIARTCLQKWEARIISTLFRDIIKM